VPSSVSVSALRLGVLAVSVLQDLDVTPCDDGVTLDGAPAVHVGWEECSAAVGDASPQSEVGRHRLTAWLMARRRLALLPASPGAGPDAASEPVLRPLGMPAATPHPNAAWPMEHVLGNALDLGFALAGLDRHQPAVLLPVPPGALVASGLDVDAYWAQARCYLEAMGGIAVERRAAAPTAPLKPAGDCDVLTLLGSVTLRAALAADNGGLCPVVVPMRSRGWTELRRIDPAFALAAAQATSSSERGFDRPLLVTVDEVQLAVDGGRPAQIALGDPAITSPWNATVPYA
jgi:hypothetical protein